MTRLAARRKETNIKIGHERWLVSYSDLVTLLFAFFVVMYSISQVNETKYRSLSDTLNAAFSEQGELSEDKQSRSERTQHEEQIAEITSLSEKIKNELRGFPVQGEMKLGANENWIELTFSSELLFESGNAEPNEQAQNVFTELAKLLEKHENEIQIEGHTDNIPIRNSEYPNNWALASARAVSIVNYLSFQGVNPDRMSAISHGEYRPIADNTTSEGRAKNRRVVVRISDKMVEAPKLSPENLFMERGEAATEVAPVTNLTVQDQSADLEKGEVVESSLDDTDTLSRNYDAVAPVKLKGGDLLFTSDPDLPRAREIENSSDTD